MLCDTAESSMHRCNSTYTQHTHTRTYVFSARLLISLCISEIRENNLHFLSYKGALGEKTVALGWNPARTTDMITLTSPPTSQMYSHIPFLCCLLGSMCVKIANPNLGKLSNVCSVILGSVN